MYSDKTPRLLKNVNTYKKKYKILKQITVLNYQ